MFNMDKVREELLHEAQSMGYQVSTLTELVNVVRRDKKLIPLLVKYLKIIEEDQYKEFIVRALGIKGYTEATSALIEEFYKVKFRPVKWAIGNSLYEIQDKKSLPLLRKIALEQEHGGERDMIVAAIGRMKDPEGVPVLIKLLKEKGVQGHAIVGLSYYKDPSIIPYLEPFLHHENAWFRREAKKAIRKLEKANTLSNLKLKQDEPNAQHEVIDSWNVSEQILASPADVTNLKPIIQFFRQRGFFSEYTYLSDDDLVLLLIRRIEEQWEKPFELSNDQSDLELLSFDETRIWWKDTESDVSAENDMYIETLSEWAHISRGAFEPRNTEELWEDEEGPITITFDLRNKSYVIHPQYQDDYLDIGILGSINELISDFRFAI